LIELKMRVNSPGPPWGAGAACAGELGGGAEGVGAGASGEFMARNICVKLPDSAAGDADAGAGAGADSTGFSADTAGNGGGVCPADEILSFGTGLKTLANSSEGLETAGRPAGSGVFNACSMRVKSP
jgi:hypothetical protein